MFKPLTPSQVARKLGVSTGVIQRACDNGLLKHWKVPGSTHRRIAREAVLAFIISGGWPEEVVKRFE